MKLIFLLSIFLVFNKHASCQQKVDSLLKYCYQVEGYNRDKNNIPFYAQGSGFFIRHNSHLFFVTAKHVLAGYDNSYRKVPGAPYLMNIILHDASGKLINATVDINVKNFQDSVKASNFRGDPDLAFFEITNERNKPIYSIESLLPGHVPDKFDSLKIIGFPTVVQKDSITGKHILKSASTFRVTNYSVYRDSKYLESGIIKTDNINYVIQANDISVNHNLKGYSGSPVFIKDGNLKRYVFSGLLIAADEEHHYMFILTPKTIKDYLP